MNSAAKILFFPYDLWAYYKDPRCDNMSQAFCRAAATIKEIGSFFLVSFGEN